MNQEIKHHFLMQSLSRIFKISFMLSVFLLLSIMLYQKLLIDKEKVNFDMHDPIPGDLPSLYCYIKGKNKNEIINFFKTVDIHDIESYCLLDTSTSLVWISFSPFTSSNIRNGYIFNQDSIYTISLKNFDSKSAMNCE